MSKKVAVLGLGNILLQDEGIGIHVIKILQSKGLSKDVEILDGGTASLDALTLTKDAKKLIIIDALRLGNEPGTLYKLKNKELQDSLTTQKLSLHQFSLLEALAIHKRTGSLPKEIILIGIEPKNIEWGLSLSKELEVKIPKIMQLITEELTDHACN